MSCLPIQAARRRGHRKPRHHIALPLIAALAAILAASPAGAQNVDRLLGVRLISVSGLLASPQAKQQLGNAIEFIFEPMPQIPRSLDNRHTEAAVANKANAGGEQAACDYAAIKALGALRDIATFQGQNAVLITAQWHKVVSPATIECHIRTRTVVVNLSGDIVTLPRH